VNTYLDFGTGFDEHILAHLALAREFEFRLRLLLQQCVAVCCNVLQ